MEQCCSNCADSMRRQRHQGAIYTVLKTFSFFKIHVDGDFLLPRGLLFFAGNLVPRGFWEREAYPVQSVQSTPSVGKCYILWARPCDMSGYMDSPIVYTIGKVWSSFCGIFDNPYAGVAANRGMSGCDVLDFSQVSSTPANLRSGSIFVSLWKLHSGGQDETVAVRECMRTAQIGPDLRLNTCLKCFVSKHYLERKSCVILSLRRGPCL